MRRAALLVLVLLVTTACGSLEKDLISSANEYTFLEARYEAACVTVEGPGACERAHEALVRWKAVLVEAEKVLGNGGRITSYRKEIKKAQKAATKAVDGVRP